LANTKQYVGDTSSGNWYQKQLTSTNDDLQCTIYITDHITSHDIVDLKRQNNSLEVGTYKPKLKVKMQSVSDEDDLLKSYERCIQTERYNG